MATCSVVNVLCTNGRRQKVKVSPQMTLVQLIQEVCKKQNLNPNSFGIRHQRKTLDSTLTVRFANLPNNAHLELVELSEGQIHTVKKCVVAMQLENGERLVHEFNSDQSLLDILEHWKSQSGRISYEENSQEIACIYANQEIKGVEKLKSTTLSMVGLNGGRGVIRLVQPSKKAEKDEGEVMEGILEKPGMETPKSEPTTTPVSVPGKLSTEEMEVESRTASSVSMTSQTSDDFTMQCAEINADQPPQPSTTLETLADNQCNPITEETTQKGSKKTEKSKIVSMDVEPCELGTPQDKAGTCKNAEMSTPARGNAEECQSAPAVVVFGGVGRTLSKTGMDGAKKPRLHSPPDAPPEAKSMKESGIKLKLTENFSEVKRETVAFKLGEGKSLSTDDDVPDDFFEVTVDDLRLMLKDLKNERNNETPLLTKTMKENSDKSKMEKYGKVAIRVYFPDRYVLQGFFSPAEKVKEVYNFVRENLHNPIMDFYLYTTPPRIVLDKPDSSLFDAKLFPAAVVYFGSQDTQEFYLSTNLLQETIDLTQANEKVSRLGSNGLAESPNKSEEKNKSTTPANTEPSTSNVSKSESRSSSQSQTQRNSSNTTGKPKWFKMGK